MDCTSNCCDRCRSNWEGPSVATPRSSDLASINGAAVFSIDATRDSRRHLTPRPVSSIVLFWTWDASRSIAIRDLMVGVALTSSANSFSTWFGVASCCSEAIFAAMASLGFMLEDRRLEGGLVGRFCGGVDQRRRRWGVSPASEKDGVVEGFQRFWAHFLEPEGGDVVSSAGVSAGVSAVVGFHRRWAHCRAPDGGVTGAFCFVGDAGFQRFFAQSRRGDTDGAATMRAASLASGASASTFPDGESVTGVGGSSGAPTGSVGEAGGSFRDASYVEIWALKKAFAAAWSSTTTPEPGGSAAPTSAVVPRPTTHAVGFGDSGARFRVFGAAGD